MEVVRRGVEERRGERAGRKKEGSLARCSGYVECLFRPLVCCFWIYGGSGKCQNLLTGAVFVWQEGNSSQKREGLRQQLPAFAPCHNARICNLFS